MKKVLLLLLFALLFSGLCFSLTNDPSPVSPDPLSGIAVGLTGFALLTQIDPKKNTVSFSYLFCDADGFSITRSILSVWFTVVFLAYAYCTVTGKTMPTETLGISGVVVGLYWGRKNLNVNLGQPPAAGT